MEYGYIKLYRSLLQNPLWNADVFSQAQAWVDLLLRANHAEGRVKIGRKYVVIDRASIMVSVRILAERWKWSRTKVSGFLESLESDDMIKREKFSKYSILRIVNYNEFQAFESDLGQSGDGKVTKEDTNNKNNNNKNNKNSSADLSGVLLDDEERKALIEKFGTDKTKRCIEKLGNYKKSTGKKYKSDYFAILDWVANRVEGEKSHKTVADRSYDFDLIEKKILRDCDDL